MALAIAVAGLLFTLAAALRAIRVFRRSIEEITSTTLPMIADMHASIRQQSSELAKVDSLIDTADSISSAVDSASRLALSAVSNPIVKAVSAGTGIARAYRVFWRRRAAH
jgi:hypothetical protein